MGSTLTPAEEAALARARQNVRAASSPNKTAKKRSAGPARKPARKKGTASKGRSRSTRRDRGLDVVRGLAVVALLVWVGADTMELAKPAWLTPTGFNGLAPIDLLPAVFLVVAGAAWRLAERRRQPRAWWTRRWIRRVVVLLSVHVALQMLVSWPAMPRWTGPLVQLALAAPIAAAIGRWPMPAQILTAGAALVGPAVTISDAAGPMDNLARTVDLTVLGADRVATGTDPYGLLPLAPAIALLLVGRWLAEQTMLRPTGPATAIAAALTGLWVGVGGLVVGQIWPINRTLASPSWALLGVAAALVAYAVGVIAAHSRLPTADLERLGRHALPAATLSAAGALTLQHWLPGPWFAFRDALITPLLPPQAAPVAVGALLTVTSVLVARWWDQHANRLRA